MRWGLSVLDWRSHASNEPAEHPIGVLRAECGHLLIMVTTLHEKPYGDPCEACAALRFDRAMAEVPGRRRPPRSGDGAAQEPRPSRSGDGERRRHWCAVIVTVL